MTVVRVGNVKLYQRKERKYLQEMCQSLGRSFFTLHGTKIGTKIDLQERMVSLLNLYSSIGNLYKEFLRAARLYAKIIISEVRRARYCIC